MNLTAFQVITHPEDIYQYFGSPLHEKNAKGESFVSENLKKARCYKRKQGKVRK